LSHSGYQEIAVKKAVKSLARGLWREQTGMTRGTIDSGMYIRLMIGAERV
jgi:hypothetical protein